MRTLWIKDQERNLGRNLQGRLKDASLKFRNEKRKHRGAKERKARGGAASSDK